MVSHETSYKLVLLFHILEHDAALPIVKERAIFVQVNLDERRL